jgi:hypothetical protein
MTAEQYGRLSIVADILGCNQTKAVELLTRAFLDQRYPGLDKATAARQAAKVEAKQIEEMAITGNPFIDKQIMGYIEKNSDKIGEWISGVLQDPGASEKKRNFAGALGSFLDLGPKMEV